MNWPEYQRLDKKVNLRLNKVIFLMSYFLHLRKIKSSVNILKMEILSFARLHSVDLQLYFFSQNTLNHCMDDKDKLIQKLIAENEAKDKKIASLQNKKKKNAKTSYALENLEEFRPILDIIEDNDRYTFTRKFGKKEEKVIKLNIFIRDLMVAKIKSSGSVPDSQISTRLSMDEASLIRYMSEGRAVKVGAGRKKK